MWSSLQPSRPKVHETSARNPLYQQQSRNSSSAPKTQIEAMPPHRVPNERPIVPSSPQVFNPAVMHPVFFTSNWRKPPIHLPVVTGFSPVATGYVFGDNRRRDTLPKL